jgi:hypothetical protein
VRGCGCSSTGGAAAIAAALPRGGRRSIPTRSGARRSPALQAILRARLSGGPLGDGRRSQRCELCAARDQHEWWSSSRRRCSRRRALRESGRSCAGADPLRRVRRAPLDAELLERGFRELKSVLADRRRRARDGCARRGVLLAIGDRRATFAPRGRRERATAELETAGFESDTRREIAQLTANLLLRRRRVGRDDGGPRARVRSGSAPLGCSCTVGARERTRRGAERDRAVARAARAAARRRGAAAGGWPTDSRSGRACCSASRASTSRAPPGRREGGARTRRPPVGVAAADLSARARPDRGAA